MAELLWSLQDSQLVARFQRRCGLFPAPDEGPSENGAGPADGEARTPELGHLPAAKGKGAGEPANGLRRLAAPQVTTGQVFAEGGGERGRSLCSLRRSSRPRDAARGFRRFLPSREGRVAGGDPAVRAVSPTPRMTPSNAAR